MKVAENPIWDVLIDRRLITSKITVLSFILIKGVDFLEKKSDDASVGEYNLVYSTELINKQ